MGWRINLDLFSFIAVSYDIEELIFIIPNQLIITKNEMARYSTNDNARIVLQEYMCMVCVL
jgi:hypothetical protein